MKKFCLLMVIVFLLTGCSSGISLPNEANGLFFKFRYPDGFVMSSDGDGLNLTGPITINIESYRYSGSPDKMVDTTVTGLSKSLGGKSVLSDFPISGLSAKKLTATSGKGKRLAYIFWKDGWIGVIGSNNDLVDAQVSMMDAIASSVTLLELEQQLKTSGEIDLDNFSITIPSDWAGSVVNHFELEMTYGSIMDGVGKFSVYVAKEINYKTAQAWAADFTAKLGWKPLYGYLTIDRTKFLTFKNIDGQMTSRVYCAIRNGNLAMMSYTVSNPEVEKEALEIAKGFRFK